MTGKFGTDRRKTPPGLSGLALFRVLSQFRRDPLQTFRTMFERFGDVVYYRGLWTSYQLSNPRDIEYVLQTNQQNYRKGRDYAVMKSSLGNGLLVSEGAFWRRQRRLAQPAFHRPRLAQFAKVMTDCTQGMLERWQAHERGGEPLDVASEMMRLTLRIVGLTLFSTDLGDETDVIGECVAVARGYVHRRAQQQVRLPISLPTRRNRAYRRALGKIDSIIYQVIGERRREGAKADDLLSMLISARDEETGESMSDKQLRDEMMTLMMAGHETTAMALSWTWYLLSQHVEVERKLHAALAATLQGRTPTFEDLTQLEYAAMVIEESMRLYPPVWIIGRAAIGNDEVAGYAVKANSEIIVMPYVTHRHPAFWDHPEAFDPERFSAERSTGRPRYAYFAFGGGPRACLGNNFAMLEATLILATIAQKYRLRLLPGCRVEPEASVTLRPRQALMMTLQGAGNARC